MARTDYIDPIELGHILAALTPPNRLACEVSLATGLRIGDVLSLRTEALQGHDGRLTVLEAKTGKRRRIRLPAALLERMLRQAGRVYVWQGRHDWRKHRSRQAVYKDLRRAARLYRVSATITLAPHSIRKVWAVGQYRKSGDIARVQSLLQHDREAVTMLYAMADQLTARKVGRRKDPDTSSIGCP